MKRVRYSAVDVSFSATLPGDVQGTFADVLCAVKWSYDPAADFLESIIEMMMAVGVRSWEEMEELVYCYVALNSPDLRCFIVDAFCTVCGYCVQRF